LSFLGYEAALKALKKQIKPFEKIEKVALTQVKGRILAQDIIASEPFPMREIASMDGFALKFADQNKPLKVLGQVKAGSEPQFSVKKNECVQTFTGSLMSAGCDTLVPVENVELKKGILYVKTPVSKGFAVRKVGESYQKNELLLKKGTKLEFSEIALLAQLGIFFISVFVKPIVGILSSGDELKDLGESLENAAQIRSINHIALATLAQDFNATARIFPLLKDDKKEVQKAFKQALSSCDILISTGGVSMGEFDFLKDEVRKFKIIVDKVAIKPGRHIKIAQFEDKFIFALPGFAYSAMITFRIFAARLLNAMLLQKEERIEAFLSTDFERKSPFYEFVACNLSTQKGKIYANLDGKKQGSSAIFNNLTDKSAILCVKDSIKNLKKGDLVEILLMKNA